MIKKSQTVKANLGITPATQNADQLTPPILNATNLYLVALSYWDKCGI